MIERFIVSTHIPKTAGTTIANIFSRCYNRRIIYDYDGYENPDRPSSEIVQHKDFVSTYFKVLHGHFYAKKYFDLFPEAHFIATLRHPVDRVISQYQHELNESSSDAWYHDELASGRMDLPTFASQPGIGDAMSLHLEGRPLRDYSLILISEQLRLSLALFEQLVKPLQLEQHYGQPAELPMDNVGQIRSRYAEVSDLQRAAVFDRTQNDNAIYSEAVSLLELKVAASS